jgi:hypothetical protein
MDAAMDRYFTGQPDEAPAEKGSKRKTSKAVLTNEALDAAMEAYLKKQPGSGSGAGDDAQLQE